MASEILNERAITSEGTKITELPRALEIRNGDLAYIVQSGSSKAIDLGSKINDKTSKDYVDKALATKLEASDIINPEDLNILLNEKSDFDHTHNYDDIKNKPVTITQDQTNNILINSAKVSFPGFGSTSTKAMPGNTKIFSGDWDDLTNKPIIPDELSDLKDGSNNRTVTDIEKSKWNSKSDFSGDYNDLSGSPILFSGDYNDLANKPIIEQFNGVTEAQVDSKINALIDGAGAAYDTFKEIQAELKDDDTAINSLVTTVGNKADKSTTYDKTEVDSFLSLKSNKTDVHSYNSLTNKPVLFSGDFNDLYNKPVVNTELSNLNTDSDHRTVTDQQKKDWSAKQDNLGFIPVNPIDRNSPGGYPGLGSDSRISSDNLALEAFYNAGFVTPCPTLTDNNDGTINISGAVCAAYDNPIGSGEINTYTIPESLNINVPDGESYIVTRLDSGNMIYELVMDSGSINEFNIIPVFSLNRINDSVDFLDWNCMAEALPNKIHSRLVKTDRFSKEYGLILSSNNRGVSITAGKVWVGAHRVNVASFDSNSNSLRQYKYSGTDWTIQDIATISNSEIAGGSLSGGKYNINWIFRYVGNTSKAITVIDTREFDTVADAQAVPAPLHAPNVAISQCIPIGRLITLQGSDTPVVEQVVSSSYVSTSATKHSDLSDVKGGQYHLTEEQHSRISGWDDAYSYSISPHAPSDAQPNVQSNWNQVNSLSDDYIKGKPYIPENGKDIVTSGDYSRASSSAPVSTGDTLDNAIGKLEYKLDVVIGGGSTIDWSSIDNKPLTFTPSTHTHAYADITGKPSLFSGNYNDLINKPSIPSVPSNWSWDNVSGKPNFFNGRYDSLIDKPNSFVPSAHTHVVAEITDFPTTWKYDNITGKPSLFDGNYNNLSNKPIIPTTMDWSDITSKPVSFIPSVHDHNDLYYSKLDVDDKLALKAPKIHTHDYQDLTNLPSLFNGDYNSLTNKPSIPVELSQLNSDSSNRLVSDAQISDWNSKQKALPGEVGQSGKILAVKSDGSEDIYWALPSYNSLTDKPVLFSGSYNDLTDKPQAPVRTELTGDIVDWNAFDGGFKTLSSNTTLTFANPIYDKTINIKITGDYSLTLPDTCKVINGEYVGTKINYIIVSCENDGNTEVNYIVNILTEGDDD